MQTIAIIIPIFNRVEVSIAGIDSLMRAVQFYMLQGSANERIELIVVDDGSPDQSADKIETRFPELTVIRTEGDLWWSGAINRGLEYAQKTFTNIKAIILQNDDVFLEQNWLTALIAAAENNPRSLIGCATALPADQSLIFYGGRSINSWFATEKKLNYNKPRANFKPGFVAESFDLYGRGIYIPYEAIEKTGPVNYKQFRHRGDLDIPLRAKKAGFKLLVSYDAIVYELPQHSFALDSKQTLSFKEVLFALRSFKTSHNIGFILNYSKIATRNPFQFAVFFMSNLYLNLRRLGWRYAKHQFSVLNRFRREGSLSS